MHDVVKMSQPTLPCFIIWMSGIALHCMAPYQHQLVGRTTNNLEHELTFAPMIPTMRTNEVCIAIPI